MDMSAVIVAKSDQWNADDFVEGPRTFTIEDIAIKPGTEQPVQIKLAGVGKVFRPCKTVSRILVAAWGADANLYRGRSLTLYTDPDVTWGGMKVGGIRVSHLSHMDKALVIALQEKKGSRKMTTVQPLKVEHGQGGLTLDQARADIEAAMSLDELRAVWSRKTMAPFREQLQGRLDELKAELSGATAGRSDDQHGETHTDTDAMNATADDIIARAKRVELLADLKALEGEAADHINAMDEVLAQACRDALAAAGKRIGGGK